MDEMANHTISSVNMYNMQIHAATHVNKAFTDGERPTWLHIYLSKALVVIKVDRQMSVSMDGPVINVKMCN